MTPKSNKACLPCHERKVRCDFSTAGTPCRSCVGRNCQDRCVRAVRRPRTRPHASLQGPKTSARRVTRTASGQERRRSPPTVDRLEPPDQVQGGQVDSGVLPVVATENSTRPFEQPVPPLQVSPASFDETSASPENQILVQICHEAATSKGLPPVSTLLHSCSPYRDSIIYRDRSNPMFILANAISTEPRSLTRVVIRDQAQSQVGSSYDQEQPSLFNHLDEPDTLDTKFLRDKGALTLPISPYREELLKVYFRQCHPHAPVFDRVEFMLSLNSGHYSAFLAQCVFASSAQYAPTELLMQCGFRDRVSAQKKFSENAALLYDLGYERSQLRMLQGSIVLGSSILSYTHDKDFRYWIWNAGRIAMKMGLHRNDISNDMDTATHLLCRRIWSCLHDSDLLLSLTGLSNSRMLDMTKCTVKPVTGDDDWDSMDIPAEFSPVLEPVPRRQKRYLVERNKLSMIGERCFSTMRDVEKFGDNDGHVNDLTQQFAAWRSSLPEVLQIDPDPYSTEGNLELTMLLALSHRFQCFLYRALRRYYFSVHDSRHIWANQQLKMAMLGIDSLIGKMMTNGDLRMLPLSFVHCVLTVLVFRIESAVDPQEPAIYASMSVGYIQQGLVFLRALSDLPIVERGLILIEGIIEQKNLPIHTGSTTNKSVSHATNGHVSPAMGSEPFASNTQDRNEPLSFWFEEIFGTEIIEALDLVGT